MSPADWPRCLSCPERLTSQCSHAHNEALLALDFVSLAVSLNAPEDGQKTMSPALSGAVPVGSLGFDRVVRRVDRRAQEAEAKVARAWKSDGLASAADTLRTAAARLGAEAARERRYWDGVLAIRADGWLVSRLPREPREPRAGGGGGAGAGAGVAPGAGAGAGVAPGGLCVRYGFAEAAREHHARGVGALRRHDDGSVRVDVGAAGYGSAGVRVRIVQDGRIVGASVPVAAAASPPIVGANPGANPDANPDAGASPDASARATIRRARNAVYEDELFFEVMREARHLAGFGMRTDDGAATIELSDCAVVIDMVCALPSLGALCPVPCAHSCQSPLTIMDRRR